MAKIIQLIFRARRNKRQGGQFIVGVLLILATQAGVLLGHLWTVSSEFVQYLRASYGLLKNNSYLKTILKELKYIKIVQGQEPQKLWEYKPNIIGADGLCEGLSKAYYAAFTFFFDYTEIFLPFIHKVCPIDEGDNHSKLLDHKDPSWKQWTIFLPKCILAHQLISEFAWYWQEDQYWAIRFIIVQTCLSLLELLIFKNLLSKRKWKTIPYKMWRVFLGSSN